MQDENSSTLPALCIIYASLYAGQWPAKLTVVTISHTHTFMTNVSLTTISIKKKRSVHARLFVYTFWV
jgi:hypothetical protein